MDIVHRQLGLVLRRWVPLVAGAALVFLLLARAEVMDLSRKVPLPPSAIRAENGRAFIAELRGPEGDSPNDGALSRAELREDGRRLGPAHSLHDVIRSQGGGAFSHWGRQIYFSSSDGSDPRTNGRRYVVRLPWIPPDALLAGVILVLVLTTWRRAHAWLARVDAAHPMWGLLAVMAVAAAYRIYVATAYAEDTYSFLVKGMPVSDARGWDSMAIEFSQGRHWNPEMVWDALRPFYWMFMGSVYALFGPSVVVARVTQMLMGVAAVGLVFATMRRTASSLFAILVAVCLSLSLNDARTALAPATEPLGAFLTCVSLFFLVLGAERLARPHPRLWPLAASGSALALANLARPLNLLAAGALPLVLIWVATRGRPAGTGRRVIWGGAALYVAAVALTLAPWIVRQRVVHGIWTMSANTAEMTYAATAPRFGVWSSQVPTIVPKGLSIGERARFYERETLKNLSTNPGFYARNVMIHAVRCARNLPGERWAMLLGVVLLSLHAARKDLTRAALVRLAAAAALLCAGLAWLPSQYLCLLWGAGLILALARRHLMALPATLLGVSVASLALVALSGGGRFLDSLDWLATAVSLWTCAQLVHAARDLAFPARPEASPPWGRAARPFILAALLGGALLLVGLGRALIAHARPVVPTPPVVLAPAEAVAWIAAVLDGPEAGDYASLRPRLEARRGVIRAGYRAHLDAGETAIHWNPLFGKRRSYAVDIFELCWYGSLRLENRAVQCIPENFAVIPGDVRRLAGTEVVLVGISVTRPLEGSSFETIALIPAGPKPAAIVLAPRDVRSAHAADLVRMAGGPQ